MALTLTLGTVTFESLEIPESIGPLGGSEILQSHDFPGGTRTIQTFGAFPEVISWRGILTGTAAMARSQEIDRMRVTGNSVTLFYGVYAYLGTIMHFHARPRYQWYIPYDIEFMPQQDLSGSILALIAQAGLAPELALAQQVGILTNLNNATGGQLELPSSLQPPVTNLLTTVAGAMVAANGKVAAISPTNGGLISAGVQAVLSAASPLIASGDPTQSSPALDTAASSTAINNIVGSANAPGTQIRVINPNLMTLAGQYLGDFSKWRDIASLNGLSDPQPTGQFNLLIPKPPT